MRRKAKHDLIFIIFLMLSFFNAVRSGDADRFRSRRELLIGSDYRIIRNGSIPEGSGTLKVSDLKSSYRLLASGRQGNRWGDWTMGRGYDGTRGRWDDGTRKYSIAKPGNLQGSGTPAGVRCSWPPMKLEVGGEQRCPGASANHD